MNIDDFVAKYNNQRVSYTGPDNGQCTAVAHVWEAWCGKPIVYGNAADTFNNAGDDYDKTENSETNYPPAGAIMVWGSSWGGGYGHTGVVTSADANHFVALEQNNPTGSNAHLVSHNSYSGVVGWFTPKVSSNQGTTDVPQSDTQCQAEIDNILHGPRGADGLDFFDHWKVETYNQTVRANNLSVQVGSLTTQLQAQQSTIDDLNAQVKDLTAKNADLHQQLANAPIPVTNTPTPAPTPVTPPVAPVVPVTPAAATGGFNGSELAKYNKAVFASIVTLGLIAKALSDGNLSQPEVDSIIGSIVTTIGVYAIANKKTS